MSREWDWMDYEEFDDVPLKKTKRIKNEITRNKIKNNRSRVQGGGATNKSFQGSDY